jgi:hypothetical protein
MYDGTFARRREVPPPGEHCAGVRSRGVQRRIVLLVFVLAACWSGAAVAAGTQPVVPANAIRQPGAKTNMDTNPANLGSAVITHAFGQLPVYIDGAQERLLPFDVFRTSQPGTKTVKAYRITTPRTALVLDTAMASSLTEAQAREDARQFDVAISIDGAAVPRPSRFWVFYRNNGPLICRIYFPGDLGTLNMGVNMLYIRPPTPGPHTIRVVVHRHLAGAAPATLVTVYSLHVLDRLPNARERAIAPDEDANPKSLGNTPLAFRTPTR